MATEKTLVSLADAELIKKTDFHDPASVRRFFKTVGDTYTSKQVWANIAMGYFHFGKAAKAAGDNTMPDVMAPFGIYRNAVEAKAKKKWTDSTVATYQSVAKTLCDIGFGLMHDGANLSEYFANEGGSIAYGTRAATFRKIADNFAKEDPSREQIVEYVETLTGDGDNLTDLALRAEKSIGKWADDEDMAEASDDVADTFLALQDAMAAYVKACREQWEPTPPKRGKTKPVSDGAAKLAARRAQKEKAGATA